MTQPSVVKTWRGWGWAGLRYELDLWCLKLCTVVHMGTYTCYWCSSSHFVSEFPRENIKSFGSLRWKKSSLGTWYLAGNPPCWVLLSLPQRLPSFRVFNELHPRPTMVKAMLWYGCCFQSRCSEQHSFKKKSFVLLHTNLLEACTSRGFRGNVLLYPSCLSTELSRQKGSRYIKMQSQG